MTLTSFQPSSLIELSFPQFTVRHQPQSVISHSPSSTTVRHQPQFVIDHSSSSTRLNRLVQSVFTVRCCTLSRKVYRQLKSVIKIRQQPRSVVSQAANQKTTYGRQWHVHTQTVETATSIMNYFLPTLKRKRKKNQTKRGLNKEHANGTMKS